MNFRLFRSAQAKKTMNNETQDSVIDPDNEVEADELHVGEGTTIDLEATGHDVSPEETEWKERYLRMASDFDNFRKRTQREKEQWIKQANQDLLRALLPIFDDLDRSLTAAEASDNLEALREGMRLVQKKVKTTLEKQGVAQIDAKGKPFDTDYHEAIAQMPAQAEEHKGAVLEVVETGYLYRDEVLRYAKVIIGE